MLWSLVSFQSVMHGYGRVRGRGFGGSRQRAGGRSIQIPASEMPHLRPGASDPEVPRFYCPGVQRQGTVINGAPPLPGVWLQHTRVFEVQMAAGACRPSAHGPGRRPSACRPTADGPGRRPRNGYITTLIIN